MPAPSPGTWTNAITQSRAASGGTRRTCVPAWCPRVDGHERPRHVRVVQRAARVLARAHGHRRGSVDDDDREHGACRRVRNVVVDDNRVRAVRPRVERHRGVAGRPSAVATLSRARSRSEPMNCVAAVDDHLRRVHAARAEGADVRALPRGVLRRREPVRPAEVVPVVDMKGDRDTRQSAASDAWRESSASTAVGRGTAAAPLRREELHHGDARLTVRLVRARLGNRRPNRTTDTREAGRDQDPHIFAWRQGYVAPRPPLHLERTRPRTERDRARPPAGRGVVLLT